jgi:hypothetical protein
MLVCGTTTVSVSTEDGVEPLNKFETVFVTASTTISTKDEFSTAAGTVTSADVVELVDATSPAGIVSVEVDKSNWSVVEEVISVDVDCVMSSTPTVLVESVVVISSLLVKAKETIILVGWVASLNVPLKFPQ